MYRGRQVPGRLGHDVPLLPGDRPGAGFNPWPGTDYECSDWKTIERFAAILNKAGYASPIRTPRGRDILAACGQLKSESEKLRASAVRKAAAEAA